MEAFLTLLLILLGLGFVVSPILAWVAIVRTGKIRRELFRLTQANRDLSATVRKNEALISKVQAGLSDLQSTAVAAPEPPAEAETKKPVFEHAKERPVESADGIKAAETKLLPAPEEPVEGAPPAIAEAAPEDVPEAISEEIPSAVAAARIESRPDTVSVSDVIEPTPEAAEAVAEKEQAKPSLPEHEEAAGETLVTAFERGEDREPSAKRGPWAAEKAAPQEASHVPIRERGYRSVLGSLAERFGGGEGDWETRIGQNWLNILGIIILVVGLVLLIQQSLILLTPVGKIAIGVGVALVLMACGAYLRRKESLEVFAFTLIGGGWGLLYFTAYAAHNIDVARIIENEYLAMCALLAVAAGIIAQSFTYRREAVTGLAYGLAFLAIHLSPISLYSLVATAVLAATIPFVVARMDWRRLGIVIAVATYATHARWLWAADLVSTPSEATIVLGGLEASQAFWGNIAILAVYWTVFCATAIAHRPSGESSRALDLATSLINMAGFIGLIAWQMETYLPGNLHYIAPPAIIAYIATSIVDGRMERPILSRLNGTIAVVLFTIALPFAIEAEDLSPNWLAPYWAVGGLVVWEISLRLGLALYRGQAYGLCLLAVIAACTTNLSPVSSADSWFFVILGLSPILLAERMLGYLNAHDLPGGLNDLDTVSRQSGLVATPLLAGLGIWSVLPDYLAGLGMLGLAWVMLEVGARTECTYRRMQSYLLGNAGFISVVLIDALEAPENPNTTLVLLASAVLGFVMGSRMQFANWNLSGSERDATWIAPAFSTFLAAAFFYWWLPGEYVPAAWAGFAFLLFETGQRSTWRELRFEAYCLLGAAAFFALGLQAKAWPDTFGSSEWSVTLAVGLIMHLTALRTIFPARPVSAGEDRLASVQLAIGVCLFASAAWDYFPVYVVPLAWAAWALALRELGRRIRRGDVGLVAEATSMAAFALAVTANIYLLIDPQTTSAWANTMVLAGVVCALYAMHFRALGSVKLSFSVSASNGGWFLHLGTILLALVLWRELPSVAVALGWGLMAFVLIELSDRLEKTAFALQAQVLVFASVIRLFFANFVVPGEAFGISHRLMTVGAVTALAYYMRFLARSEAPEARRLLSGSVFSWIGAGLLVILARFEVGREHTVAIWSILILIFALLGIKLADRDFRYQAYLLCVLVFGRAWATNAYLEGTIWGFPERVVTTIPSLAALFIVVLLIPRSFDDTGAEAPQSSIAKGFAFADRHARSTISLLFAAQLTLLVFYQMTIDLVSIGWAVSALFLLIVGFALKERSLRLFGLALLLVCLFKVVFVDLEGVETIYRVFSFIVLGLVLLLASLGYSRFRDVLGRYL